MNWRRGLEGFLQRKGIEGFTILHQVSSGTCRCSSRQAVPTVASSAPQPKVNTFVASKGRLTREIQATSSTIFSSPSLESSTNGDDTKDAPPKHQFHLDKFKKLSLFKAQCAAADKSDHLNPHHPHQELLASSPASINRTISLATARFLPVALLGLNRRHVSVTLVLHDIILGVG